MELKKSDIIPNKEPGRNVGTAGFSLIEISIVLVIIGILVSVSIAGMNLVRNIQADKVVIWVQGGEQSMLSFLDRRGRFA
ncbi:MAG: prepilin-type N-terminal cleavage/methylation domain-containing protein, partial [Desulfoplanes sp.]